MQQLLDTALEHAPLPAKERFARLASDTVPTKVLPHTNAEPENRTAADAELRLSADPNIAAALDWLDHHAAGWEPGTARRRVACRLAQLDVRDLRDRASRRGRVTQRRIAQSLGDYYGARADTQGRYGARYGTEGEALTSVLTRPDWLDLDCPLIATTDRLTVTSTASADTSLDEDAAECAVQRLAESLAVDVRLVDTPLYRLLGVDVRKGEIGGSVGVTRFVEYVLTMDLLEGELVDALAGAVSPRRGSLPLRDRYLPDLESVLDVSRRLCAGGALALCAIARPANPHRGRADYLLLGAMLETCGWARSWRGRTLPIILNRSSSKARRCCAGSGRYDPCSP
jgi:hypothetical protein